MNDALPILLAQADGGGPGGGSLSVLLWMGALLVLFYAFLIRPQNKRDQEQRQMREALKKGDQVVTSGGLHGKITAVSDEVLTLEVADRVRVRIERSAVARQMGEEKGS